MKRKRMGNKERNRDGRRCRGRGGGWCDVNRQNIYQQQRNISKFFSLNRIHWDYHSGDDIFLTADLSYVHNVLFVLTYSHLLFALLAMDKSVSPSMFLCAEFWAIPKTRKSTQKAEKMTKLKRTDDRNQAALRINCRTHANRMHKHGVAFTQTHIGHNQ